MSCNCNQNPCTCGPQPYYMQTKVCKEDNEKIICNNRFSFSVKPINSWNIPLCGQSAILDVPGVEEVSLGSYLWNTNYGYFLIAAVNFQTEQITIVNTCVEGNKDAGIQIPFCTDFIVTDPPANINSNSNLFPYVAIDFTAPANGDCIDILVTTVNGLISNHNVQIGAGTYRVSSIGSNNIITICNDGSGITPGTPVIAKNSLGQYQYPIIITDSNPCINSSVTSGTVIACSGGVASPLTGPIDGSVLVLQDHTTGIAEYQPINLPVRVCTTITVPLSLVPATASYSITVADSSVFAVSQVVQIGNRTDRVTVTAKPDSTHITGTFDPVPSIFEVIPAGTPICDITCCESQSNEIIIIQDNLDTINTSYLEPQCVPQLAVINIPVIFASSAITLGGDGSFSVLVTGAPIFSFVTAAPAGGGQCLLYIEANLHAYSLTDITNTNPYTFLQEMDFELRAVSSATATPVTAGKMVNIMSGITDGWDPPTFPVPGAPESIEQLLAPVAPNYPMMYFGGSVSPWVQGHTNEQIDIYLTYRCAIGVDNPPTTVTNVQFMITGIVKVFRR